MSPNRIRNFRHRLASNMDAANLPDEVLVQVGRWASDPPLVIVGLIDTPKGSVMLYLDARNKDDLDAVAVVRKARDKAFKQSRDIRFTPSTREACGHLGRVLNGWLESRKVLTP